MDIEERGVKLRLTVVDTPGFGDALNSKSRYVVSDLISLSAGVMSVVDV